MKRLLLAVTFFAVLCPLAVAQPLGHWETDTNGLPVFSYDAPLPYSKPDPEIKIESNPWWILGNYRITLFAYGNGEYEMLSGERSWARMNAGDRVVKGVNDASVTIGGRTYDLAGAGSLTEDPAVCRRLFGCGYAEYTFKIGNLEVRRRLSVLPSLEIDGGDAAVLVSYTLTNRGSSNRKVTVNESVLANYQPMYNNPVKFTRETMVDGNIAAAEFTGTAENPMDIPEKDENSLADAYAPTLYLVGDGASADEDGYLSVGKTVTVKGNSSVTVQAVVGFMFDATSDGILAAADRMKAGSISEWLKVLPMFPEEKDRTLAQELTWHAYTLEAMATYSSYYKETKIPQGTAYDYDGGQHLSARDNLQHGLAPIYYNPKLAASILRYLAQRTTGWGEIRLGEFGYGHSEPLWYSTSDQQLFYFQMLAEYLRVTGDLALLDTKVQFYPKNGDATMLEVTEQCFNYLRQFVGLGPHGLVKLLNSDWNDCIFSMDKVFYNDVFMNAESLMNTTMALSIIDNLVDQLDKYSGAQTARARKIAAGMNVYRENLKKAFLKDMGDAGFARRMYFAGKSLGDDQMWLEPQGYLLQMKDFPLERKLNLYKEMQDRLYKGEKLGARQQEKPIDTVPSLEPGSRENGGFWYSLNGPVICGVATFDKPEAMRLLKRMSFANNAASFPQFWTSYFSSADNVESSLMGKLEGLADQSGNWYRCPVFCAHPHAWLLYCYYKINEPFKN